MVLTGERPSVLPCRMFDAATSTILNEASAAADCYDLMTVKHSYTCNLCKRELLLEQPGQYPAAWALTWTGPGIGRPENGARLEPSRPWADSPVHLCTTCVHAVAEHRQAAVKAGEWNPKIR